VRRAVVSADSVAVVVVRAVVTVRVVTAAVMLARARRVVLPVTSLLSCMWTPWLTSRVKMIC
jgi:hypothetical protein